MDKPLVTIITATFNLIKNNRKDYFLQMVNSIRNQTYDNIEHLIIDGGSEDGSIELFKELGLKYISEKDEGIYDAFNKGVKLAHGKYINFMNSDDYFSNNKTVELSVCALEKKKTVFSFGRANIVDENNKIRWVFKPQMDNVLVRMPFCHQTMFIKTETLRKEGGFNRKYKSASDYDLVIKLVLKKTKYVQINDILASFRLGGESNINMKNSCLEQIKVFQDNYSKYIDIDYKKAENMVIAGHCSTKFLIKTGMTDFSMYRYVWWRRFQKFIKEILYYGPYKDKAIIKFIKKRIIEPNIRVIKSKPTNLDEFVETKIKQAEYYRSKNFDNKSKIIIVIPIYKENPEQEELASLIQCAKILKKYEICFLTHRNLNFSKYKLIDKYKKNYKFEYFNEACFENVNTYSKLCLNPDLYRRFKDYDYMFLYQLDGWVFKDELELWANQGYDYIGAPWLEGYEFANENSNLIAASGNGGVSLRNILKFIKITDYINKNPKSKFYGYSHFRKSGYSYIKSLRKYFSHKNQISCYLDTMNEDYVIVNGFKMADRKFKIAPSEIALKFSFEVLPEKLYKMNNNQLPFACHAWEKYGKEFYKNFIDTSI